MGKKKRRYPGRARRNEASPHSGQMICYWVVAFLDILGYRSVLEQIDVLPAFSESKEMRALEEGFGRAIRFRRRLIHEVNSFLASVNEPPDLSRVPQQARSMVGSCHRTRLIQSPGPDHIILACSLQSDSGHFPLRGIYNLVGAVAAAMLIQLSLGADDPNDTLPLRGGIDLALGTLLQPENFLYSPALTRAYDLESKKAIYPRAIAGQRLIDFLDSHVEAQGSSPETGFQRSLAERTRNMFFKDRDGEIVLDFLGSEVRENLGRDQKIAYEVASSAWQYVQRARAQTVDAGDEGVAAKYTWLVEYMTPRIPAWGIKV